MNINNLFSPQNGSVTSIAEKYKDFNARVYTMMPPHAMGFYLNELGYL